MSEKSERQHEIDLAKAKSHLSVVAMGLVAKIGPIETVGVLLGAAIGVLETNLVGIAGADLLKAAAQELEAAAEEAPTPGTSKLN